MSMEMDEYMGDAPVSKNLFSLQQMMDCLGARCFWRLCQIQYAHIVAEIYCYGN